ncbi:ATP-binding cassette domain-containing protein [Streptomyces sp. NPDC005012]|uniref:ABC transporter ATP-binding protein n=1 Tax=Streptomyces sp. NPDC005012 TaxID=3154558 RepID=UPI0033A15471
MIDVTHLTKRYGGVTAVDDLTFTVRPGRVTGFLGPNGAGKSTTLRVLLGLHRPTAGTATVDGRPFAVHRRGLRRVGALLDAQGVRGGLTARAHLSALARAHRIAPGRVAEVLEEAGLAGAARRRIGGFSLGMRQRLGIAAALLGDPPVLVLDEPFNGLDPEGVRWVRGLLRRLAAEGRTVLVSSHLMSETEHTADDLVVVGRGRLIAAESLADFSARGATGRVTVRTSAADALSALLAAEDADVRTEGERLVVTGLDAGRVGEIAGRHGIPLSGLHTERPSLEEAFMRLTADAARSAEGDAR